MTKRSRLLIIAVVLIVVCLVALNKVARPTVKQSIDPHQFLTNLKGKIVQEDWLETEDYSKLTLQKETGKFAGFDWINQAGQVELINGYYLSYDPFDNDYTKTYPSIAQAAAKIRDYLLAQGFELNDQNTYFEKNEEAFWAEDKGAGGQLGLEKNNLKCSLATSRTGFANSGLTLYCGDLAASTTPEIYEQLYALENPDNDLRYNLTIDNHNDSFAIGGVSGGGSGVASLWQKTDGQWQSIQKTQMGWDCQLLLDKKIPPSLFGSTGPQTSCFYYGQTPMEPVNYSQLYQQTFPQ